MRTAGILLLLACLFAAPAANAQQPDNKLPMYGKVEKNEYFRDLDIKFINHCKEQFGTIDSAVKVHNDYGWRYFYNNELETAMKRFNQAWLLDPEYPDAYFGFAALMEMRHEDKAAADLYKMGGARDTDNKRAKRCYQRIADCKEQLKDYPGTIEAYKQLSRVDPDNAFACKKLGFFLADGKHNKEALQAYDKAIELDPADAMTYMNRAYLYQTQKKYKLALEGYAKAIELDSTNIGAYANRGAMAMEQQRYKDALPDLEACVRLNEQDGSIRRMLALAKWHLKDKEGACQDLQKAQELGDELAADLLKEYCK
jgi:tetratricopeptide (TPR) repeat protein